MANELHLKLLDNRQQLADYQSQSGNVQLDFSASDLRGKDLSKLPLARAIFTGADLQYANLEGADLSDSQLQNAKCGGATFNDSKLKGANFSGADFGTGRLLPSSIIGVDARKSVWTCAQLPKITFKKCRLDDADFEQAQLRDASFIDCDAPGSFFHGAALGGASLHRSDFSKSVFTNASVAGTDFFEVNVNDSTFNGTVGCHLAKNLHTVRGLPYDFERCERPIVEKHLDWEFIRKFGRMPLFGASYISLVLIIAYLVALQFYNEKISATRRWAEKVQTSTQKLPRIAADPIADAARTIIEKVHPREKPDQAWLMLASTVLLAAASTIYAVSCPDEVQEFSRSQWCYQLNKPLVHYWPRSWTHRKARVVCAIFYVAGGLLAGWVIVCKLWWVVCYLYGFDTNASD